MLFNSYFNKSYLVLIIISILVNYFIGTELNMKINNVIRRKILLIFGIVFNLGALGYFKYYDFFIENINYIFKTNFNLLHIMLPLGISFVIDSYHRKNLHYDFLSYCLFLTFFSQLIA